GEDPADIALPDRRAGDVDGGGDAVTCGAAGGNRNHHRIELELGRAFGEIGALSQRDLRVSEVDHAAGLHAARQRVAEPDHVNRMAALPQPVLWRTRL